MVSPHRQYRLQGWVASALVHVLALTVALGLAAQLKPVVPKEVFKWDVALVDPQQIHETSQAEIKPAQEPAKPTPPPAVPAPSQLQKVTRKVQPREETQIVQRESPPIEETVAVQARTETVMPVKELQPTEVKQVEQSVDEPVNPVTQQEAVTAEPAIIAAPVQQVRTQPTTAPASETRPPEPIVSESSPQLAMAARPTPAVKADYGWLVESLRQRLAEVKRYPSAARLNGWEGKVVLRAVIRADGHLSEVRVHRSSGYEALDNAAMEAIRLVCPLHMTNAINAAEVAIYVPMVYTLGS